MPQDKACAASGRLGRVDEIASQRKFAATAVRGTVDGGNEGNRTLEHGAKRLLEHHVLRLPGGIAHAVALL
jgi:hypothetical protein